MSTDMKDGGPAFPVSTGDPHKEYQDGPYTAQFPGLSLRDYFAAKAMQGFLAGSMADGSNVTRKDTETIAGFGYFMADAMLKARQA